MIGQVYRSALSNIIYIHTHSSYSEWWSTTEGIQAFYHQSRPRSPYPDYRNLGTILMGLV